MAVPADVTASDEPDSAKGNQSAQLAHKGTAATPAQAVTRDGWPAGPWDGEDDRYEWRDAATGLPCLIVRNRSGALCGYAGVQPGHPWHGKNYNDVPADAHGGLTYSDACTGSICHVAQPGEPDDVWWLGFDTAHAFDLVPSMEALRIKMWAETKKSCWAPLFGGQDIYRDVAYVRAEVASLAQQIVAAAK